MYSSTNLLTTMINAAGNMTTYAYDPYTYRQIQKRDGNGVFVAYGYDADLRMTNKAYPNGTLVTYNYDAAGQRISFADSTGYTSTGYDRAGRVITVTYANGQILTYSYDSVGNRTAMLDPRGGLTQYQYTNLNDLAQIVDPQGVVTSIIREGSQDFLREIVYPNGVACNLAPIGHLVPQFEVARTFNGPGSAVPFSTQNVYDNAYNRTKATETDQFGTATVTTYVYDSANQLKGEHRSGANGYFTTYVYDSLGNRIQKIDSNQVTSYTYNPANQLLLTQPPTGQPTTSTYDGNGNLTLENAGGALTTYTWDYENRLSSIVTPTTGLTTFLYADNGQKRQTITQAATTNFLWDGDNILQEQDASGTVQAQYTQGPGTWGMLLGQRRGTTDQFYTNDSSQNARQLVDVNGNVTDTMLYKAFGELVSSTGTSVNHRGFGANANYWLELPDHIRAGARILLPSAGRWSAMDRLRFRGGSPNFYEYVDNNPIANLDPSGLVTITLKTYHLPILAENFHHAAVEVKERCGRAYVYEGEPRDLSDVVFGFTQLYARQRPQDHATAHESIVLLDNDEPATRYQNILNREVKAINAANFTYWVDPSYLPWCNSNTVAYDFVRKLGLSANPTDPVPGWGPWLWWVWKFSFGSYYECSGNGRNAANGLLFYPAPTYSVIRANGPTAGAQGGYEDLLP